MALHLDFQGTITPDHDDDGRLRETRGGWLVDDGPLTIRHSLRTTDFYRQGWNSWSPTGWSPLADSPMRIYDDPHRLLTADDAALDKPGRHEGSGVGALRLPEGGILLLGALGLGSPRVGASETELRGTTEAPGAGWFVGVGDEDTVFARYAELVSDSLGRPPAKPIETMWCSWYSFFEAIDEDLVRTTVAELDDLPFDVVQLDDGWEEIVGDWTPNARFGSGMARVARQISERGSTPGLWLAPFICLPGSSVAANHPDWLVHDQAGGPLIAGYNWDSHYYALDTTNPEVQDHLRTVFAEVVGWGFGYLKLDFLYAGALGGRRALDVPREQAYRDALALIREVVGPDVYLLGCGAPMLPSVGILDGIRVGPDTASDWTRPGTIPDPSHEGGLNGLTASIERLWMRDLYQVDPDVAFFRSRDTTLDPDQKQALADLAVVAGFRSTSDPAGWLTDDERIKLDGFLSAPPTVAKLGRYRYDLGGREADFGVFVREARRGRERLRG